MAKTLPLGDRKVSVPGFGAMGLNSAMGTDLNLEESEPVLLKAVELGCTFWDTAVSCLSIPHTPAAFVSNWRCGEFRLPTRTAKTKSCLEIS